MADTARFWPNQPGSARIEVDSTQIEADSMRIKPRQCESEEKKKKKKSSDAAPTHGQPRRTPRRVGLGCGTLLAVSVLSSIELNLCNILQGLMTI